MLQWRYRLSIPRAVLLRQNHEIMTVQVYGMSRRDLLLVRGGSIGAGDNEIDELIVPIRIGVIDNGREILVKVLQIRNSLLRMEDRRVAVVQKQWEVSQIPTECTFEHLCVVERSVECVVVSVVYKLVGIPRDDWTKTIDRLILAR